MATIELYKSKINNMSGYIDQAKSAVGSFCVDLSALRSKILSINSSVCDSIAASISTSSQTQDQQIAGLEATQKKVNDFIDLTVNRDNAASSEVARAKNEFYKQYSYLKPECEKTDWEKFCDGLKKVGDFCKEHWKLIVTVVICIAAVALICTGVGGILGAAALGALIGAASGGLIGGITSVMQGGSFLDGFEEGAFSGAVTGAIMGGLGGAGALFGKSISCLSTLGKAVKMTAKITGVMSTVMGGFDTLAMGMGMLDPDNPLTALNSKLHSSKLYNAFQIGVTAVAVFTGAASSTMACFVAGTMVLTAAGLIAIEKIAAGDTIIASDPDTLETAEKTVLETYVRKVDKLVRLVIGGEEIITTDNHPFFVQGRGFIEAGSLLVGDKLVSVNGDDLFVEEHQVETPDEPVEVFNFQVEDFHTYFVGENRVWVHNKNCTPENRQTVKEHLDGTAENTGPKSNGAINGCHEENSFLNALEGSGGDLTNTIEPINGVDGVNYVEYRTANGDIKMKTIYDSNVISTDDYINRGLEAYSKVPESATSGVHTYTDNSGTNWNMFLRDGKLITLYPTN